MLDALVPHAHIHALICPFHDTIAMSLVLRIITLVAVTRFPFEDSESVLLVRIVHTLIRVALRIAVLVCLLFLPLSVAVLETVEELPGVAAAIGPLVLAKAFWLSLIILPDVAVTVGEEV